MNRAAIGALSATMWLCGCSHEPDRAAIAVASAEQRAKVDRIEAEAFDRVRREQAAQDVDRRAKAATAAKRCESMGGARIGMTRAELYASCWGKPQSINTTAVAGGEHEQLVYPGYQYVYLRNGVVTSIQTSR